MLRAMLEELVSTAVAVTMVADQQMEVVTAAALGARRGGITSRSAAAFACWAVAAEVGSVRQQDIWISLCSSECLTATLAVSPLNTQHS